MTDITDLTDLTEKIGQRLAAKFIRAYDEELAAAAAEISLEQSVSVLMGATFPATALTLANAMANLPTKKMRAARANLEELSELVDAGLTSYLERPQ
jgi:adenylosuccinate lyase